jgi:hypothetical protein
MSSSQALIPGGSVTGTQLVSPLMGTMSVRRDATGQCFLRLPLGSLKNRLFLLSLAVNIRAMLIQSRGVQVARCSNKRALDSSSPSF